MSHIPSSLLLYPFSDPGIFSNKKILIWGARYVPEMAGLNGFEVIQVFKPFADDWRAHGFESYTEAPSDKKFDVVFMILPQQNEAALFRIAQSLHILSEGGMLVAAAENDAGGKRLQHWIESFGIQTEHVSKKKCRIVWGVKNAVLQGQVDKAIKAGEQQKISLDGAIYTTKPGIFGWNKIDTGSKLLCDVLPQHLQGRGADFGCGYGYLSRRLLHDNKNIKKFYAIDADHDALTCCRENLAEFDVEFMWEDLSHKIKLATPLDWIVMNPPFHEGGDTRIPVGQAFIITARAALKKGGVLYMVANSHLPYEKILADQFENVEKIIEKQGFKVFKAQA